MKMKFFTKITLLFLMVACLPLSACSQSRILSGLPTGQGVDKVYVSKAMVKMGANIGANALGSYKDGIKEIEGIEIYSCGNKSLFPSVKSQINVLMEKYNADIMIETEECDETSAIYTLYKDKEKQQTLGMAIVSYEAEGIDVVIIHGNVDFANMGI